MADPIFVAQPGGGQAAVSGLSSQNIADIVAKMSAQAGSKSPNLLSPYRGTASGGSALNTVSGMGSNTGSSSSVTSSYSAGRDQVFSDRMKTASQPYVPELVASWTDESGGYHPASVTRPNPEQASALAASAGGSQGFNPSMIQSDPRYQLLQDQADRMNEQRAQTISDAGASYDVAEHRLAAQQDQQSGAAAVQLARMGGLGTSASGLSYLQSLDAKHMEALNDLQIQKQAAINQAQRAYDQQQYDIVGKQLDVANQIEQQYYQHKNDQIDNLIKYRQLQQYEKKDAQETLSSMAAAGITADQLPQDYLSHLDEVQGVPYGTSEALFSLAQSEQESKQKLAGIELQTKEVGLAKIIQEVQGFSQEQAGKLVDVLNKVPAGHTISIDGVDYAGWNTGNVKNGVEIDNNGQATGWTFDPASNTWSTQSLGYIGSKKDGFSLQFDNQGHPWNYNPATGQLVPVSQSQTNWASLFPDGTVAGQCGAFVNKLTGLGVGDSLYPDPKTGDPGKVSKIDRTIGTPSNPLQIGDVVVQSIGGWTGHVALVNSMYKGPDGKTYLRLTESNYHKDGKVTNFRTIAAEDSTVVGFGRGNLAPALRTGTDSPSNPTLVAATFGNVANKLDQPLSDSLLKATGLPVGSTYADAKAKGIVLKEDTTPASLDARLPDDVASALKLPVGTTYAEAKAKGLVLPPSEPKANYELRTGDDNKLYRVNTATGVGEPVQFKGVQGNVSSVPYGTGSLPSPTKPTTIAAAIPQDDGPTFGGNKTGGGFSQKEVNDYEAQYPGINIKLTDSPSVAQQKIDSWKATHSEEIGRTIPSVDTWQNETRSALSQFKPRSQEVADQITGNTAKIHDRLATSIPGIEDAVFNLMLNESDKNRSETAQHVSKQLKNGQLKQAGDTLKAVALNTSVQSERVAQTAREEMIRNLQAVQNKLDAYKRAGGNMGIIAGNVEGLAGRIGKVRDPKLRELAGGIQTLFFDFRRAYTGGQFTPQETAQYEAVFPGITGDFAINEAKIKGLVGQAKTNSGNFYRVRIGDDLYNNLFGDVRVVDIASRQQGSVPAYEFDPSKYIPL